MDNNDVLRGVRYALDIDNDGIAALFDAGGVQASPELLAGWLRRSDDPETIPCSNSKLEAFLDALIVQRRGPPPPGMKPPPRVAFTNNAVLKKLRIALQLTDVAIIEILRLGGHEVSRATLGGLFRPPNHKHYRQCGDQFLRGFLRGLARHQRWERKQAGEGAGSA
jgi:uncharacterized protein YehS (DUF1456 family)